VQKVEYWLPLPNAKPGQPPGKRIDLFGFGDAVGIRAGEIFIFQFTSGDNLAKRIAKARSIPAFTQWCAAGGWVEFHGWRKAGARGEPKRWRCRRVRFHAPRRGPGLLQRIDDGPWQLVPEA